MNLKKETKRIKKVNTKPYRYMVGDKVRVSYTRSLFKRGFDEGFSREIFTVLRKFRRDGTPLYILKDEKDEFVKGSFYERELTRTHMDVNELYKIDKIIKKVKKGGVMYYLVNWLGWPKAFQSLVKASDIVDIIPGRKI